MKKNNLWRVIWIVGIYAVLVLILYLVIMYKVKWEDKDLHKYLYFYNCNESLCTSDVAQNKYYSRVLCEDDVCPYVSSINDNLVILNKKDKSWIYDYANEIVLNDKYISYEYLKDNYYIVKDNSNNVGLINNNDETIIPLDKYGKIIDFKNNYLLYFKDGMYYIKNNGYDKIIFLKPLSFMNLSGEVVKKFVSYYKIDVENVLVIHDDLDLEIGKYKLKFDSSSGGHNGIKSIINMLNSQKFGRLKVGISKSENVIDFVLSKFSRKEQDIIDKNLDIFRDILNDYENMDIFTLMNKYN